MSLFHDDLNTIAEAHNMSASLPHSASPEAAYLHAAIGSLGAIVRRAHALHSSGDTAGAAEVLDPQITEESLDKMHNQSSYEVPGAGLWRIAHNGDLASMMADIRAAVQIGQRKVNEVSPIHGQTLEAINGKLKGLHSSKYRSMMNMVPADHDPGLLEAFGHEDPDVITIKPKLGIEKPQGAVGRTMRQIGQ
jgi:hypothetical protein